LVHGYKHAKHEAEKLGRSISMSADEISKMCSSETMTLEIGCGKHRHPKADVAIDILKDSFCDIVCDAHKLPFIDKSFSKVFMFEVLEHVKCSNDVLTEIYRVLKLNGKLFFFSS
jgi:predicted SAM-dependent methyltransferase